MIDNKILLVYVGSIWFWGIDTFWGIKRLDIVKKSLQILPIFLVWFFGLKTCWYPPQLYTTITYYVKRNTISNFNHCTSNLQLVWNLDSLLLYLVNYRRKQCIILTRQIKKENSSISIPLLFFFQEIKEVFNNNQNSNFLKANLAKNQYLISILNCKCTDIKFFLKRLLKYPAFLVSYAF